MQRTIDGGGGGIGPARRRRILQLIFVFVNLALVEAHLPGPLWLAIGAIFWGGLVGITVAGSNLVCGTMCWIGAIQDFFEPFARPRVRVDPRFGRALTLAIIVLWMPVGWMLRGSLTAHDRTPVDFSLAWEPHLFGLALAALTALSVVFLGKRGICRFFCPFNPIVARVRKLVPRGTPQAVLRSTKNEACTGVCSGCRHGDPTVEAASPAPTYERLTTT